MDVDPTASMRCWAVTLELGGREFEIPALPAADWWPVLSALDLTLILDFLTSSESDQLDEMLLTGEVGDEELSTALTEAVAIVAGRSFHVAAVLVMVAEQNWSAIGGQFARDGFRWDIASLGAALDATYLIMIDALPKKEDRDKFTRLLENERLTGGKRKAPDREKVISEFESLAGPKPTGGVRATGAPSDGERPRTRQQQRQPRQDGP